MTNTELLETYYNGFAKKQGWEEVISDDFKFVGGDMTKTSPIVGKQAYIEVIERFSKLFTTLQVKKMFVSDDGAFVLANYDYVFPGGKSINGNVAELWEIKGGKLDALTIFFDTLTFHDLTAK
jgi:ketosteroid isomerase-like protein